MEGKGEKRDLEDKIKKDFRDEEAKLIVIGYNFTDENRNLIDDLMGKILKEDVKPIGKMQVVWKRMGDEDRKSVIILDTGSRWSRDHILGNQRAGKSFIVKKSIPK